MGQEGVVVTGISFPRSDHTRERWLTHRLDSLTTLSMRREDATELPPCNACGEFPQKGNL